MAQITDTPPKYRKSFAHALIAPLGTVSQLQLPNGLFNSLREDTKRYGSVVVAKAITAQSGHALVMATGSAYNAKWTGLNIADDVTVTTDSSAAQTGSDSKPKINKRLLGALDFPIVTEAQIKDGNHAVNSYLEGGKKFGSGVIVALDTGRFALVLAAGIQATDKWHGVDGTAMFTPTAETVTTSPFDKKPKAVKSKVNAIPFPVVDKTLLGVLDNNINSGDGISSGKRIGSMVVAYSAGITTPTLYMASGDAPSAPWVLLKGDDATGAITPA